MSRTLCYQLIAEGTLVTETPLSVGGAEPSAWTDAPFSRDGLGQPVIPGTALAGAIRHHFLIADGDERFGSIQRASRLVVDDAVCTQTPGEELWHGNGIDRVTGTVADKIKFDREVLPGGSRFAFRVCLEGSDPAQLPSDRAFLHRLLDALEQGRIAFGAANTRGLGVVRLEAVRCHERDLSCRDGVLAWLSDDSQASDRRADWRSAAEAQNDALPVRRRCIEVRIDWCPRGPVMGKAGYDGQAVDILPQLSARDGGLALVLPGSSLKGALRSLAERIVRTCLARDVGRTGQAGLAHHEQIALSVVDALFGRARGNTPSHAEAASRPPDAHGGRRGMLSVETCYARRTLSRGEWAALDRDEAAWREKEIESARRAPDFACAMHVAVDRFTGGAAESFLYSAVEPFGLPWEPITLRFAWREDEACEAPFALLWLVLRELACGRLPIGYGVNRGYGTIKVSAIVLEARDEGGAKLLGANRIAWRPRDGDLIARLPEDRRRALGDTWRKALVEARAGG